MRAEFLAHGSSYALKIVVSRENKAVGNGTLESPTAAMRDPVESDSSE